MRRCSRFTVTPSSPSTSKRSRRKATKRVLCVVQQVIKEVNQGLVDDSLIQNDKIGSGVFFWSFPSKEAQECANEKQKTENALKRTEDNIETLTSLKRKAELTRCASRREQRS